MKRLGIYGSNGTNPNVSLMYAMNPGMVTSISMYMSSNRIDLHHGQILIRFMHPKNWHEDPPTSARNFAAELIEKLPEIDELGAYWYFANELNLHYENNWGINMQEYVESPKFYKKMAGWTKDVIDRVKQARPDTKAVMFPFAYGHHEDGAPDDNGKPKDGWAGYDYFHEIIKDYFDSTICGHYYWGDGYGEKREWLHDVNESSWHAFRWKRVINLFNTRYNIDPKIIIDECGNFQPDSPAFQDDVIYYAKECFKDEHILGVTPFLWADPTGVNAINDWQRINDLEGFVHRIAETNFTEPKENPMWHSDFNSEAIKYFDEHGEALNDAEKYNVSINPTQADANKQFKCIGVHHLTPSQNHGNHHLYVDVLNENGKRMYNYIVKVVKQNDESLYLKIEKPESEPGTNLPIFKKDVLNNIEVLSVNNKYPSDKIDGISTAHPDEKPGNTLYHHSFYVVFQLKKSTPTNPGDTDIPTDPQPNNCDCKSIVGKLLMSLVKSLFC